MIKIIKSVTVLMLFCICYLAQGQDKAFTLQRCIDTALQRNLLVNQDRLQVETAAINRSQAKLNILPNLNIHTNHYNNQGRSIDPSTNSFVTQRFFSASYNVGTDVVLFQGLSLQNLIRQRTMDYEAAQMDLQYQKDHITISVILAYLQMMNTEDILQQMLTQAALTQSQTDRLKILDEKGAIAPATLYDVQGQLAGDQLSIINARTLLQNQRIYLCRLMNIEYSNDMIFQREIPVDIMQQSSINTKDAYETSLKHFAKVRAAEYRLRSAGEAVRVAKGNLFPSLKFGSGFYSNFSGAAQGSYFGQINNNLSSSFGVTLSLPVFNSLRVRNEVKKARIHFREKQFLYNNVKTELQQDIEEAYNNMTSAFERYTVLSSQVEVLKRSFSAAEAKFNVGQSTSIDYLVVKNNLDKANISLITATYDYTLRVKVFDYYLGRASME